MKEKELLKKIEKSKNELITWLNEECPGCFPPLESYTTFDLSHDFCDGLRNRLDDIFYLKSQLAEIEKANVKKVKITKNKKDFKEIVVKKAKEGKIIISTFDGLMEAPIDDIIEQPVDGLLYDINRDEGTILTFLNDPKWLNDYACAQVIRKLHFYYEKCKK